MGKIRMNGGFKFKNPKDVKPLDYAKSWAIVAYADVVIHYKVSKIPHAANQIDWMVVVSLTSGIIDFFSPRKITPDGKIFTNGGEAANGKCAMKPNELTADGLAHELSVENVLKEGWLKAGLPLQINLQEWMKKEYDVRAFCTAQVTPAQQPPPAVPKEMSIKEVLMQRVAKNAAATPQPETKSKRDLHDVNMERESFPETDQFENGPF